ncbi:MAG: relaxase/mobilization nuclease domain-containing protein [Oscillospiraceae bacterium]|nr:relaxase/mobilization nuclease domain-containing protein [Oscillospiraceae bacterium]
MATTGFWPVKGSLKAVIQYADNPDKTTNRKYLDRDLADALQYVENDVKTDEKLFVSAINCDPKTAYEDMTATKARFGKHGGNVAYHGYQSFRPGEVTPEECHRIGLRTAREMWGDQYEIVVTTHLNTDSLHNHFIINSVSFKTGRKYENHIRDHIRLREISDHICREHALSVLEGASFYGGEKGAYWARKSGQPTHRDILKADVEYALEYSDTWRRFWEHLHTKGYEIDYERRSLKAPSWGRAVRLDRLGYPDDVIEARLKPHRENIRFFHIANAHLPYRPKRFPLLELEQQIKHTMHPAHSAGEVWVTLLFFLITRVAGLTGPEAEQARCRPLSPEMRMDAAKLDRYDQQVRLMAKNGIETDTQLRAFISETQEQIADLEAQRQGVRNKLRRASDPEEREHLKQKSSAITEQLKPLRKELKTARDIEAQIPVMQQTLETERKMETQALQRERNRSRER